MAWPAALTVRTLHGKIIAPDVDQTPAVGSVIFDLPYALRDSPDNVIIGPMPNIVAPLVNGEFTIDLPVTDDPDISPVNWVYKVTVRTDIWQAVFPLSIPSAGAPAPLEFADLAPSVTPPALIVYALQGHTHAAYIPYSLAVAKGDILVATGAGVFARKPVGANGLYLQADASQADGLLWAPAAGGGGGFKGVWNPLTVYNAGETVLYRDGYYATVAGAGAGVAPVVVRDFFSGPPTNIDVGDFADYLFRGAFTVSARTRVTGLTWYKLASQINVPHETRLYNITRSTVTPLATAITVGAASGSVGTFRAPIIADVLPGNTYAAVLVAGAGAESGYAYTPAYGFPQTAPSSVLTMQAGGFANGFANITAITNPGTNYANIAPQWEEPSASWVLVGRLDPVVIGNAATYNYPIIPV